MILECGHQEWKDGHCATMTCSNYINKRSHRMSKQGNVQNKAIRLHREGKVTKVEDGQVFAVQGDNGKYMVITIGEGMDIVGAYCSCPAEGYCSHMGAAALTAMNLSGADPFEGLTG